MPPRIAIVGTGLVGTSIGLGLKRAKLGYEIVGHDKDPGAAGKAKQRGAVDKTEWNLISTIDGASLVVLALPLDAIKPTLEAMAAYLGEGCVVTDTATSKAQVLAWADAVLPEGVSFIGGDPLLAKASSAADGPSADLLVGATYCLTPAVRARPEAVELVVGMVSTLGAQAFFLDPVEHDTFVTAVEHLPVLLATALMTVAAGSPSWREIKKVTGGAFLDMTTLVQGSPAATAQMCALNRESILHWLDSYMAELGRLRGLVDQGGPDLERAFQKAADSRARWLRRDDEAGGAAGLGPVETPGDIMRRMFVGELGKRRPK